MSENITKNAFNDRHKYTKYIMVDTNNVEQFLQLFENIVSFLKKEEQRIQDNITLYNEDNLSLLVKDTYKSDAKEFWIGIDITYDNYNRFIENILEQYDKNQEDSISSKLERFDGTEKIIEITAE